MDIKSAIRRGVINAYDYLWIHNKERNDLQTIKTSKYQSIIRGYTLSQEQKDAIDSLYVKNLGEKIPYGWHQFFAAHSGVFTPNYFPDYLLQAHFEHYMNYNTHYAFVFEDKNVLPYIAKWAGVRIPRTILSKTCGVLRDGENVVVNEEKALGILRDSGMVFCKPSTISCGGSGCFVEDFSSHKSEGIIRKTLMSLGEDFVIQELLHCHPSISTLYSKAVNTFRVITYRWKDGFFHMPVFMRLGRGGAVVDNGAQGGLFVGITDDGHLTEKASTLGEIAF